MRKPILFVVLAASTLASSIAAQAGEYIINYKDSKAMSTVVSAGGVVTHAWPEIDYAAISIDDASAAQLGGIGGIVSLSRDQRLKWIPSLQQSGLAAGTTFTAEVNQTGAFFFDRFQWYLRQISADVAGEFSDQGAGALVCVLDTGVDPGHLDLAGKVDLSKSASFVAAEPFIEDINFHGTFVSALVASNGLGMASVAPNATLCAVKVLDATGSGSFADIISGILHAASVNADVINMSLGALIPKEDLKDAKDLLDATQAAIKVARKSGTLVVASAGNDGLNLDRERFTHVPSMLNHVVSVGATAPIGQMDFDTLASYSNFGRKGLDVQAPGGDLVAGGVIEDLILSACSRFVCGGDGIYLVAAGTSFSTPLVAATAAIVESDQPGDNDGDELRKCIFKGADRITGRGNDPVYGRGRVNVVGASNCERLDD